ncbi:hypothetical protein NL532_24060 [Mesorhizobium sp. C120A]|uniref:phage adaptor protein n=1 Tax=unclassified Mesorhizobium TaxID=325217 RepID=UPI0003D01999|nr:MULTISPECIES: hypothetical protein [unclassified Mesorhizobium]ESZ60649.1 hypothetical protein X728_15015 [Mesorhizobium sp. L103C120A0]WJI43684.1 hypothetical protein NL532_24060 [Mesorhizobium sp. C120A]
MNFLDLCKQVASDSATFDEGAIASVVGQVGRKAKVVRWTNMAWRSIQNAHVAWRWMQSEFSLTAGIGTQRYAGTVATDTIASATIDRFAEWICCGLGENRFRLYDTTIGLSDIGPLKFVPWDEFYAQRVNTSAANGKPSMFSIDPANKLCLSPVPDLATYVIVGPYRKSVQALTVDADVPEMPTDFHDVISSVATQFLQLHDEGMQMLPLWKMRENSDFCRLEARQLPQMTFAGPLA